MNQTRRTLKIGTRKSPLALAQADLASARLKALHPDLEMEIVPMTTTGDEVQHKTLGDIGGKGLFTKELEDAMLRGEIDIAVHSMKDMPTILPEGLEIACLLEREDPRDAFISPNANTLVNLPKGAIVGSASLRRTAQIKHLRPDIQTQPLRGNVQTRLRKLAEGECAATLLAVAGLNRLSMQEHITEALSIEVMLPAVAQGAIGIECRSDDEATKALLKPANHQPTEITVTAERAMLAVLDGSCRTPIAAYAEIEGDMLHLDGLIALPDGSKLHRHKMQGKASLAAAQELGQALGELLRKEAGEDFMCAVGSAT